MFLCHFNNAEPGRPSFFEMIAQQQLLPTLGPALKYAFTVFSQRNPRWEWFVRNHDEIWACVLLFIEYRCLHKYDASFAENFYGLKRVRVGRTPNGEAKPGPLTTRDRYLSLLLLVVVPYLKQKLDQKFERWSGPVHSWLQVDQPQPQPQPQSEPQRTSQDVAGGPAASGDGGDIRARTAQRLERFLSHGRAELVGLYPFVHAVYEGLFFVYQLLYLYDHTRYYTPTLHLQRLQVTRLSTEDLILQTQRTVAERARRLEGLAGRSPLRLLFRGVVRGWDFLLDYSQLLLPASLFLFKFLEWWYAENRQPTPALPTPPPPPPPKRVTGGLSLPPNKRHCAICLKERTNAAMLPTGYVFCYPCIFNYVATHHKCPITLVPANMDQICKIYEST
jgi:peroxin-12